VIYEKASIVIGGDVRQTELLVKSSFNSRIGIWLRSADVFIYSFPFGVGENVSPLYYNSSFVPTIANQSISQQLPDSYWGLVYSNYTTKTHNVFFHFVTEYNILGFLVLILFIKQIFKNFSRCGLDGSINNAIFRATIFSMILAIGIMGLFESADRLYFLYSMLLFFSYLNPSSMIEINNQNKYNV